MAFKCVAVDRWDGKVQQVVLVDEDDSSKREILKVGEEDGQFKEGALDHVKEDRFYDSDGEETESAHADKQGRKLASPKPSGKEQTNADLVQGGAGGTSPTGLKQPEELQQPKETKPPTIGEEQPDPTKGLASPPIQDGGVANQGSA